MPVRDVYSYTYVRWYDDPGGVRVYTMHDSINCISGHRARGFIRSTDDDDDNNSHSIYVRPDTQVSYRERSCCQLALYCKPRAPGPCHNYSRGCVYHRINAISSGLPENLYESVQIYTKLQGGEGNLHARVTRPTVP